MCKLWFGFGVKFTRHGDRREGIHWDVKARGGEMEMEIRRMVEGYKRLVMGGCGRRSVQSVRHSLRSSIQSCFVPWFYHIFVDNRFYTTTQFQKALVLHAIEFIMSQNIPKTCKAVVIDGPNAPWAIKDVPVEMPKRGEVLVKVQACGVCHSDSLLQKGLFGPSYVYFFYSPDLRAVHLPACTTRRILISCFCANFC